MVLEAILGIVNGILSNSSQKDYAKQLEEAANNQKVSEAVGRGENIYREMANTGLPGYENQKADINSQIPTTLNQMKDYVTSGGLVDAMASLSSGVAKQQRQLSAENEKALIGNKQNFANYLGSVVAPAEQHVSDNQTQLNLAAAYEKMLGKQSKMTWMNTGVGSLEKDATSLLGTGSLSQWIAALLAPKSGGNVSGGEWTDSNVNPGYNSGGIGGENIFGNMA